MSSLIRLQIQNGKKKKKIFKRIILNIKFVTSLKNWKAHKESYLPYKLE